MNQTANKLSADFLNQIDCRQEQLNSKIAKHNLWLATKGKKGEFANFAGVDLSYLDLSYVNFEGVTFEGANLERAFVENANFKDANFRGANLQRLIGSYETMSGAIVTNTIFDIRK